MTKADIIATVRTAEAAALDHIRSHAGVLVGHTHVIRTGGGLYYLPDGACMAESHATRDARGRRHGVTAYAHEAAHYTRDVAETMAAALRDGTGEPSLAVPALQAAREDAARLHGLIARLAGGERLAG